MSEFWIQEAIKRPGRVIRYMKRKYGDEAFKKDGTLKKTYLRRALKEAKDPSLKQAIRLALWLKDKAEERSEKKSKRSKSSGRRSRGGRRRSKR